MRMPRRKGVVSLVGVLAAAGVGSALAVSAGADPPGGTPPGGGTSNMPAVVAAKLAQMDVPGRGHLKIENDTLASGDHLLTYSLDGKQAVRIRDSANCPGRSSGVAQVTQPSPGVYEITGVTAMGAQGLVITLADGTTVQPTLSDPGSGDYPFFDIQVSSAPVNFNTTGVAMPHGCGGPQS